MQIEIKLDENCKEPKIIVVTNKMTDEINEIMKRLSDEQPKMIAGFKDDIVEVLEPFDIYRIFAALLMAPMTEMRQLGSPTESTSPGMCCPSVYCRGEMVMEVSWRILCRNSVK